MRAPWSGFGLAQGAKKTTYEAALAEIEATGVEPDWWDVTQFKECLEKLGTHSQLKFFDIGCAAPNPSVVASPASVTVRASCVAARPLREKTDSAPPLTSPAAHARQRHLGAKESRKSVLLNPMLPLLLSSIFDSQVLTAPRPTLQPPVSITSASASDLWLPFPASASHPPLPPPPLRRR
eukprot:SAG11_NODE_410_length_9703_cov_3.284777_6_plen_180_part_00